MQIYWDCQAIEFNDQIRKSHYTFEIHGDDIKFWPVPTFGTGSSASSIFYRQVWIEYLFEEEKSRDAILFGNTALIPGVVSDASNIPYTYQTYSTINDMGRSWIFKYACALAKEMLGFVRGKYSTIPIPGADVTLNGSDLLQQGQAEKDLLITQLREFLDKLTKEEADKIKYQAGENLGFYSNTVSTEEALKLLAEGKRYSEYNLNAVVNEIMRLSNNQPIETGAIYNAMSQISGVKLIWEPQIDGIVNKAGGYKVDVSNYEFNQPLLYGLDTTINKSSETLTEPTEIQGIPLVDINLDTLKDSKSKAIAEVLAKN